jgi:dolichyl-phosphate-mannose-protein mannosyltransferase
MTRQLPAWAAPVVCALVAGGLLAVRLGQPDGIVFDEVYYVEDARSVLDVGVEEGFAVHPPLGKWLIGAGIALLGDHPVGWRASGVVAGALMVLLTVLLVRRLTGRIELGVLAGGLLVLDGVFVVQARTAMLDIHLALFVLLGAYLLVVDHQRPSVTAAASWWRSRWALLAAGAAFGAAVATKWSGALALVAAALLVATWDWRRRRTADPRWSRGLAAAALAAVVGLAVPAVLIYLASWTPWIVRFEDTRTGQVRCEEQLDATPGTCTFGATDRLDGLVDHHLDVARFHLDLDADHPYRAPATTWPIQARPVVYHWASCAVDDDPAACEVAPGNASEVVALGNPALWWVGLALLPLLVAGAVRRDGRSSVPLAFLAAQYLPWLVVARPVFSFYAVPMVPFLAAGVAVVCGELDRPLRRLATVAGTAVGGAVGAVGAALTGADRFGVGTMAVVLAVAGAAIGAAVDDRRPPPDALGRAVGTSLAGLVAVAAIALAVYFAPVWYAVELPEEAIRRRWWFPGWV